MCSHDLFELIGERLRNYYGFARVFAVVKCVSCGGEEVYGTTEFQYTRNKGEKRFPLLKNIPVGVEEYRD